MNIQWAIILAIILSVIATATNVDLANNTTILLILLLAIAGFSTGNSNCCCGNNRLGTNTIFI